MWLSIHPQMRRVYVLKSGGLGSPLLSVSRYPPNKGLKKPMTENSPQRDLSENKNLVLISKTATVMWCVFML